MRRRLICFLLSAVLLLGMVCTMTPNVYAASEMKASDTLIEMIKDMEGFVEFPYEDGSQYSVGYGTRVEGEELEKYLKYGITEAEADKLLREFVAEFEEDLNNFIERNVLTLSQNQFDALLSLTYNSGPRWMKNNTNLSKAVVEGYTGNDFIHAMTQWCNVNSKVSTALVKRRLSESNMYLNGEYSNSVPSKLSYVLYDCSTCSCTVRVQGYNTNLTDTVRAVPFKSGYDFLGWYDSDGTWITVLDSSTAGKTLTPRWQKAGEGVDDEGNVVGTEVKYTRYVNAAESLIVRETPSASAKQTKTLKANQKVTVVAEYLDSNDIKWGKLSIGGWINLSAGTSNDDIVSDTIKPITVTVKQTGVNIRSGPGTKYSKLTTSVEGEKLEIVATAEGGMYLWGKSEKGWICLDYTNYAEAKLEADKAEEPAEKPIATGVIVKCGQVNVRKGAGTRYAKVGQIVAGTTINIYETVTPGLQSWCRSDMGWICMDYVELVENTEGDQETEKPEEEEKPEETGPVTGKITASYLNIRSKAGTSNRSVGFYKKGDKVTILETTLYKGASWGRTEKGWISMKFVELDEVVPEAPETIEPTEPEAPETSAPTEPEVPETSEPDEPEVPETSKPDEPEVPETSEPVETPEEEETVIKTGVIINTSQVNIRAAAGVSNAKVGTYVKGTRVNIYETVKVAGGAKWARTDKGWVHMFYIKLDKTPIIVPETPDTSVTPETPETPETDQSGSSNSSGSGNIVPSGGVLVGKVVNSAQVNVRASAGVDSKKVGTYTRGTRVVIYETVNYNGATWGRTDKGWIHMFYVQLENITEGIAAGTVTTQLSIRTGPGVSNARVGVYSKGDVVIVLEVESVNGTLWGRTDKGWISLYYVK